MGSRYGHEVDPKTGKVRITAESAAAQKSAKGRHGDFQKDGLGSRVVDSLLKKLGR